MKRFSAVREFLVGRSPLSVLFEVKLECNWKRLLEAAILGNFAVERVLQECAHSLPFFRDLFSLRLGSMLAKLAKRCEMEVHIFWLPYGLCLPRRGCDGLHATSTRYAEP